MLDAKEQLDLKLMSGQVVLVTGATGLIGQNLIHTLVSASNMLSKPLKVIALVRNRDKARRILKSDFNAIECVVGDVNKEILIPEHIDYVIHAASQTSSRTFVEQPISTINTAIIGTTNILELAKEKNVKKLVYLSTMEVYGSPSTDEKIDEMHGTNLDPMMVRSCYPESKRVCENLCVAYMKEYGVPVNVVRLTQTFGPGVEYNDGRVFAEFARCVIEKRDIVLHTKGETKRNYLYTQDAVNAILTVMIKGKSGEAYNAANEDTYCSIYEMAKIVSKKCSDENIKVTVDIEDENKYGYAPVLKMNLDTRKLQGLGWTPKVGLEEMFCNLISDMQNKKV